MSALIQQVDTQVMVINAPFAPIYSFLMPLLLPTALAGVLVGFALVVVELRRTRGDFRRPGDRADADLETVGASTTLQKIPVFICGAIAVVALTGLITNEIRRAPKFHPGLLVALALLILLGSPVVFWRSRWQRTTVGAATVAIAVLAFITGFSIGVLFIPLVIAMVLVCFSYLRRAQPSIR